MTAEPGLNRVTVRALVAMSRPTHLLLVTLVYGLGVAIAYATGSESQPLPVATGLLALLPIAASIHYANEYADVETDMLTTRTRFSGGSGALPRTGLPRELAYRAAWASLILGVAVSVICLLHGFPVPALGVLLLGAIAGWQYSLPPLALAWHGWGELDNALAGGVVLPAYGYAATAGTVDPVVLLAAVPFFTLVFANLLDTTWPDRHADAAVGKETLATRWPKRWLRGAYLVAVGSWLGSLLLLRGSVLPTMVTDGSLVVLPIVIWGSIAYTRSRSPFPTVAAMVLLAVVQLTAWLWIGLA